MLHVIGGPSSLSSANGPQPVTALGNATFYAYIFFLRESYRGQYLNHSPICFAALPVFTHP